MAISEEEKRKKNVAQIVKVVNDILGGQSKVLQRIEDGYKEQNTMYRELLNKFSLLDKKLEGGFTVLENNRIASLDANVSEKLKNLDYDYLKQLKIELDSVHLKLLQQVQAQIFRLLIKNSQSILASPITVTGTPSFPKAVNPSTPTASIAPPQPAVEEAGGDWTDSELEGAQIYDSIITGWKRRDWEGVKGTKEIFMRGWKNSSKSDKQKIKNGAWSKPIMNKMKMLGREQ